MTLKLGRPLPAAKDADAELLLDHHRPACRPVVEVLHQLTDPWNHSAFPMAISHTYVSEHKQTHQS